MSTACQARRSTSLVLTEAFGRPPGTGQHHNMLPLAQHTETGCAQRPHRIFIVPCDQHPGRPGTCTLNPSSHSSSAILYFIFVPRGFSLTVENIAKWGPCPDEISLAVALTLELTSMMRWGLMSMPPAPLPPQNEEALVTVGEKLKLNGSAATRISFDWLGRFGVQETGTGRAGPASTSTPQAWTLSLSQSNKHRPFIARAAAEIQWP